MHWKNILISDTRPWKDVLSVPSIIQQTFTEMNHKSGTVLGFWDRKVNNTEFLAIGTHGLSPRMNSQQIIALSVTYNKQYNDIFHISLLNNKGSIKCKWRNTVILSSLP